MWFMFEALFLFSILGRSYKCFTSLCPPNTHYWLPSSLWGFSYMPKCVNGKQMGKKYKISRFMSKLWDATTYGDFLAEETGQAGLGQRNFSLLLLWKAHGSCVKTIRLPCPLDLTLRAVSFVVFSFWVRRSVGVSVCCVPWTHVGWWLPRGCWVILCPLLFSRVRDW